MTTKTSGTFHGGEPKIMRRINTGEILHLHGNTGSCNLEVVEYEEAEEKAHCEDSPFWTVFANVIVPL